MKKVLMLFLILILCVTSTGCKSGEAGAREVLNSYIQNLKAGAYENAYNLLSDFDKTNVTLDEFIRWRELAGKIQTTEGYSIGKKVDTFKNFEYKGAQYKKAHGYAVTQQLIKHHEIEPGGYDAGEYHIMVGYENNEWKIAFLIIELNTLSEQYERKLEEAQADTR